jgi:butyrate kinase
MQTYKIFTVNPGSTSTKLAMFENDKILFQTKVVHTAEELSQFKEIADQYQYREEKILNALEQSHYSLDGVDVFVGRSAGTLPVEGGIYHVTPLLIEHAFSGITKHPAILGCKLVDSFAKKFGGEAYVMNPPDTDEFDDVARVTGLHDIFRGSQFHALNQKETAIRAAAQLGKRYEDVNFVIAHIGGGVSVTAHRKGRAVDTNSIIMGEGPFTPTRAGALPTIPFMKLCFSGKYTEDELYDRLNKDGGLIDLLNTSEMLDVVKMIEAGDGYAKLIYDAFLYQIGKNIGSYAAVLRGKIDAIILTGGVANDKDFVAELTDMIGFLAPVMVYPGELELEALAAGGLRLLQGEEQAKTYSGISVFQGFDHYKRKR